jgi:hypothetical protein
MKKSLKIALLFLVVAARLSAQPTQPRPVKIIVTTRYSIFDDERRLPARVNMVLLVRG